MAVVQRGGGQQLHADDGAGEHHDGTDQHRLGYRVAETQGNGETRGKKQERTQQRDPHCLTQHLPQFLGEQVQPEQVEQEHDADMGDIGDQFGIIHQAQAPGPQDDAEYDIGNDHRLARIQRQGRQDRGAGKNQEQ